MSSDEMFDSSVRAAGDLAGVFEYDGSTGYFYLYEADGKEAQKVLDAICVFTGEPDFEEADISIRWDQEQQKVGLFIRGILWAVFDHQQRAKYGGGYEAGLMPNLPSRAIRGFVATR